jgi:hypothetical protein
MDETFESVSVPARAHEARRAVAASARCCMQQATQRPIAADAATLDRYASDDAFRELHKCVDEFARVMQAHGESQIVSEHLLMSALAEAAEPGEAHPALVAAIRDWFRDAFNNRVHET